MQRATRLLGLFLVTLCVAACGRTSLGDRCTTDAECGEFFCVNGFCSEDDNNQNVLTNNCTLDCCGDDCPTNNISNNRDCYETDALTCVFDPPCDEGAECMPLPCDLGCPPDRGQEGCECVAKSCETAEDCAPGLVCIDGGCEFCVDDSSCAPGEVCSMGTCVPDADCGTDADCPPSQRCAPDGVCRDRPDCLFDDDCPRNQICFAGRCTLSEECTVDEDCPNGQECVGGNCFVELCRGPEDCPADQLCDAGECVDPPAVSSCVVVTQDQLIAEGQRVPLEAFAFDANGVGIAATFSWSSSDSTVARIVPGPSAQGGASAGVALISAVTTDGVACSGVAQLENPGPIMPASLRVVVNDMESGLPVAGAEVIVNGVSATTNAQGVATLADPPVSLYEVSVFDTDYNYLTIQGVSARDIRLQLQKKSGTGPVSGFTGEFDTSGLHTSGNITLGLAGASLAGGLLDFELTRLLGDTFVTLLDVPGVVSQDIPLPGGLIGYGGALGFNVELKRTYYAQSAGGPRITWGLAGEVPFGELLDFAMGGGFDGGSVIAQLLPLFNRFDHAAVPQVMVELPRVSDTIDIDRDGDTNEQLPDYLAFPQIDMRPSVQQTLVTDVAISNFPVLADGPTSVAVLVGGAVLPSPGFAPMGISATADEDGDFRPDLRRLSIAPAYGPLVGSRYSIVALTFGNGFGFDPSGFELPREYSASLWSGQSFPTALSLGTFPDASQGFTDDSIRTVYVSSNAGPMHRVRMVGTDRTWDVWTVGPPGIMGQFGNEIVVPAAPGGADDIYVSGDIFVDAIQTNANMDDLISASGIGLRNAGLVTSAYNRTLVR